MRIIKAAKQQDEIKETCNNCGSILGLAITDITYYNGYYGYKCPVCNQRIDLSCNDKYELFKWYMEDDNEQIQGDNLMRVNTF